MRILLTLLIILAVLGGYSWWQQHYSPEHQMANGAVHWDIGEPTPEQKAAFEKENSGETADGNSEHKNNTARGEAAAGNPGGLAALGLSPVAAGNSIPSTAPTRAGTAQPVVYPPYVPATPATLPMYDSQFNNAPNGVRFGGSGTYQWYRQGDLTYRIDTSNGSSCIAYATLEEWRKPIVYNHGCGRGA
jgi:hypothetical protein